MDLNEEMDSQCIDENVDKEDDNQISINDLPYVVLEYILSYLSPYKELIDCKLVSKSWYSAVKSTIVKLRRDFMTCLCDSSLVWDHYSCPSDKPSISPRYSHSSCRLEDSVYVFGGCTIANTTFNDLWRFDLSSRSWIRPIATGTFPSPKACASLVHYNNKLILFGGWTHSSPYPIHREWRIFKDIHVFDTRTDRWTLVDTRFNCPAIAGHSASIVGDQMIVFGGLLSEANSPSPFSSTNDIWVLNLCDYVWHKQPTTNLKPLPRYGHSSVVIDDNHLLIMGGSGGPNNLFSDIWLLSIPQNKALQWQWNLIDIKNRDQTIAPQISFHPAIKVGNLVLVLSASNKVRTVQCKDGNIIRKPPIRSQYVGAGGSESASTSQSSSSGPRLEPQLPPPSSSSTSTNISAQTHSHSLRPISRKNRQRQLEGLDRMEQRIRQQKAIPFSPLPLRSAIIKSNNGESAHNPMQLFVLDISHLIDQNSAHWFQNQFINDGPEDVILYTLVAGRAEIIMFGGIQKDKNMKQSPQENSINNVPDIVSNQLHIITAKRKII